MKKKQPLRPWGRAKILHVGKYILFAVLILFAIFFRFYQLENRMQFTWDQIQNAWVMKGIIDDGTLPLLGMVAKGNSGFHIGPAYYYLLAPFYYATDLNPIAAGIFTGIVGVITCLIVYLVFVQLFSSTIGFLAGAIYIFSYHVISFDRIPWPVSFIPAVSILVFYFLIKIISGKYKYLPVLAALIGFSFHIHFTSIYYVLIVLACSPFFLFKAEARRYIMWSIPIFLVWFIPNLLSEMQTRFGEGSSLVSYAGLYTHGFHVRRFLQLAHDAFIEFESILYFRELRMLKFVIPAIWCIAVWKSETRFYALRLIYLTCVWFIVPWVIMSLYSGEISNYYFSPTRTIAIGMIAYTGYFLSKKSWTLMFILFLFLLWYIYINTMVFLRSAPEGSIKNTIQSVKADIREGKKIPFVDGDSRSYFYYLYGERSNTK